MNPVIDVSNMSNWVSRAFFECLFRGNEDTIYYVAVRGAFHNIYSFNPERLEEYRGIITKVLEELPEKYKNGWTFMELYKNKNGQQWTNTQVVCDRLVCLAIGLGLMQYVYPRDKWRELPYGLPYIVIKETEEKNTKNRSVLIE